MSSYYGNGASFRRPKQQDEADPMSSLANFGDVMLVFACGLMVALVAAWQIDLGVKQLEVDPTQEVEEVTTVEDILNGAGNSYIERGTAYQDPVTGNWYVIEEDEEKDE